MFTPGHAPAFVLLLAGYGEVDDGRPTWAQREMHVYTNMVRVDPTAWSSSYDCNLNSFSSSEKQSKEPLRYHDGLTEVAQLHSEDMESHNFMDHDSSDGTSFSQRVWPYYEGTTIAENVAWGYQDNSAVIWEGWMCSDGHRANIMDGSLHHLGTGVEGKYYTQDFGGGAGGVDLPVDMGVHVPQRPTNTVSFLATWSDADGPDLLVVAHEEECIDMERTVGSDERGAWAVSTDALNDCTRYRFLWTTADGEEDALPQSGSYQYGNGCAEWVSSTPDGCQPPEDTSDDGDGSGDGGDGADGADGAGDTGSADCPPSDRNGDCLPDPAPGEDPGGTGVCGCTTLHPAAAIWALPFLALAGRRRRR